MASELVELCGPISVVRCRRKIDGNTWEFTCAGKKKTFGDTHPHITYIGRKLDAECPLCEALALVRVTERKMENVALRIENFIGIPGFVGVAIEEETTESS